MNLLLKNVGKFSPDLLARIAADLNDVDSLRVMSTIDHCMVLQSVAANKSTPLDVLEDLSVSQFWEVRETVVKHPNVSKKLLVRLSHDTHSLNVRLAARYRLKKFK